MTRIRSSAAGIILLGTLLAAFVGARSTYSQYAPGGAAAKGSVKSSDGKALEGVTVSVREEEQDVHIDRVHGPARCVFITPSGERQI